MIKPCKVCKRQPKIWETYFGYGNFMYFAKCACDNEHYDWPTHLGHVFHTNEKLFITKGDALRYWNAHH